MGRTRTGLTAERFVDETVALIVERGGSHGVNLREVSRRLGCAHTNVYNYFPDLDALLWEAYRRALAMYAEHLTADLPTGGAAEDYIRAVIERLVEFPLKNPGLYRFISSDPFDTDRIPHDVIDMVARMKQWFVDAVTIAGDLPRGSVEGSDAADILLAYVNGESLDLMNGRVLPHEDMPGRVFGNAMRLFRLLLSDAIRDSNDGYAETVGVAEFPKLTL